MIEANDLEKKYVVKKKNQDSNHPLGAVQVVIRGRIRNLLFGLLIITIAIVGFYIEFFTDIELVAAKTLINTTITGVLLLGCTVYGVYFINLAFSRINLRSKGFEVRSIFRKENIEYEDVTIHLDKILEHKNQSNGYRSIIKAGDYNYIWVCTLIFNESNESISFKSSHYAFLYDKITNLNNALKDERY